MKPRVTMKDILYKLSTSFTIIHLVNITCREFGKKITTTVRRVVCWAREELLREKMKLVHTRGCQRGSNRIWRYFPQIKKLDQIWKYIDLNHTVRTCHVQAKSAKKRKKCQSTGATSREEWEPRQTKTKAPALTRCVVCTAGIYEQQRGSPHCVSV